MSERLEAGAGEPPFLRFFGTDFWTWLAAHPNERAAERGGFEPVHLEDGLIQARCR